MVCCDIEVGIDLMEIDNVSAEVLNHVSVRAHASIEAREGCTREREGVLAKSPNHEIDPGTSDENVIAESTQQTIVAIASV